MDKLFFPINRRKYAQACGRFSMASQTFNVYAPQGVNPCVKTFTEKGTRNLGRDRATSSETRT